MKDIILANIELYEGLLFGVGDPFVRAGVWARHSDWKNKYLYWKNQKVHIKENGISKPFEIGNAQTLTSGHWKVFFPIQVRFHNALRFLTPHHVMRRLMWPFEKVIKFSGGKISMDELTAEDYAAADWQVVKTRKI